MWGLPVRLGFPEPTAAAIANAVTGLSAAMAAQLVWTQVDVVSQRLMVCPGPPNASACKYLKPMASGNSTEVLGCMLRPIRCGGHLTLLRKDSFGMEWNVTVQRWMIRAMATPLSLTVVAVQGVNVAMAGGVSALITMSLDTINTRMQVLDGEENGRRGPTVGHRLRNLVKERRWTAYYRGLGLRWASMSMFATTMITTYEFLKRLTVKNQDGLS